MIKTNDENVAVASANTLLTNRVRILRVGEKPASADSLIVVDEESLGFDPYDTASLFVPKAAQKSAD